MTRNKKLTTARNERLNELAKLLCTLREKADYIEEMQDERQTIEMIAAVAEELKELHRIA